jgi:hypothetical protein
MNDGRSQLRESETDDPSSETSGLDSECFVLAPIGEADTAERQRSDVVLNYIVRPAASAVGLDAVRADEISRPGTITLQVIDHVLNAKAVVADLTGHNPNVFYELGVRHAVRGPVVLIAETGSTLPFDVGHERTIFFDHHDLASANQCKEQIAIQLTEGIAGSVDSPVTTAVDLKVLRSGSPIEKQVAKLVSGYESVTSSHTRVLRAVNTMVHWISELMPYSGFGYSSPQLSSYVSALQSNLARLEREIAPASGIDSKLVDAIFRDTRQLIHTLVRELRETERHSEVTNELAEALGEFGADDEGPDDGVK